MSTIQSTGNFGNETTTQDTFGEDPGSKRNRVDQIKVVKSRHLYGPVKIVRKKDKDSFAKETNSTTPSEMNDRVSTQA